MFVLQNGSAKLPLLLLRERHTVDNSVGSCCVCCRLGQYSPKLPPLRETHTADNSVDSCCVCCSRVQHFRGWTARGPAIATWSGTPLSARLASWRRRSWNKKGTHVCCFLDVLSMSSPDRSDSPSGVLFCFCLHDSPCIQHSAGTSPDARLVRHTRPHF